jgi:hypothetical protein
MMIPQPIDLTWAMNAVVSQALIAIFLQSSLSGNEESLWRNDGVVHFGWFLLDDLTTSKTKQSSMYLLDLSYILTGLHHAPLSSLPFFFFVVDGSVSRVEICDVDVENVEYSEKRLIVSGSRSDGEERKERIKRNRNPSLIFFESVFSSVTSE